MYVLDTILLSHERKRKAQTKDVLKRTPNNEHRRTAALHTETLTEARIARTLSNITRRAETLLTGGGYKVDTAWTGFYHVLGPQGQYFTVITDTLMGAGCDCKAFAE